MSIVYWVIFGLIAGILAKWIMPGDDPKGCIITVILGIFGSVLGGFIGTALGLGTVTGFDIRSMFIAVMGTILILALHRKFYKR